MKLTTKLSIVAAVLLLTACASGPRKVSMTEAMASENQIITAAKSQPAPPQLEKLYTQPINKTEPCKLPTSKDQLERKNFRAYWDGDCKDGYAHGLGRDIALSDTHHVEEVTIHNGDGGSNGQPWRLIDYVQNHGAYGVRGTAFPATAGYNELITNNGTDFSIRYYAGATDDEGNLRYLESSPFSPVRVTVNQSRGNPAYVLVDYSALPATSDQAQTVIFAADPVTKNPLGFRIVRFRNGVVQHQKLAADGQSIVELVQLPPEYLAQLTKGIGEAQAAVQKASADAAKAQQMEREYLHMACTADYSIKGVPAKDMEIARQICTWRDQWKEPYARAEAKYKQEMEQKQREVAQAEQQRAYIAAQQMQAAAAQSAAFSASMNQMNQALQQQNNNTLQQINQMNQQLQNQNNQMMESWAPQQNKTTICNRIGNQVFCR
ncbi:hypothetical protein [Aeromonas caviae]|uniref:hypothetical protein n=1 Tax=Aeromonas caviae TaxID=648 RepID=UPI00220775B9|nr:hypothetical protein [Aeromonas caviae]BDS30369.1 hypothetical protein KAM479c_20930 [Aeromonas caviae]